MNNSDEEEIKQEETSVKKEHSYTYWVDKEKQNNANVPKKEPKQIDPTQIQQTQEKHVSSWNQSGTWEEKKIDVSQVKELLEKSLKEKPLVGVDNRTEFYNVSKVEGEVTIVAVRGKKRAGYHLKISIKYRGINEYKGGKGLFKYTSFSDDGDRDFQVETSGEAHVAVCKKSVSDSQDILAERLVEVFKLIHE